MSSACFSGSTVYQYQVGDGMSEFGMLRELLDQPAAAAQRRELQDMFFDDEDSLDPYGTEAKILRMCLQDYPDSSDNNEVSYYQFSGNQYELQWNSHFKQYVYAPVSTPVSTPVSSPVLGDDLEQRLECPTCGRLLANRTTLLRHLRVVHGPRVWHVCAVCGKHVTSPKMLYLHSWQHTSERPYRCPECHAGFVRRSAFHAHREQKHGVVVDTISGVSADLNVNPALDLSASRDVNPVSSAGIDGDLSAGPKAELNVDAGPELTCEREAARDGPETSPGDAMENKHRMVMRLVKQAGLWKVELPAQL